jgi:tripartite-type tricarboxylate transporter receptor subunit TctC
MNHPRRRFLHLAVGAAALPVLPRVAWPQTYPVRPVRIIVPFSAGGPQDFVARQIGQWLTERLGQPFVIENRVGAGGNIGTEVVAKAPPDGYTLLMIAPSSTINATLYDKLNFNFIRDIAPIAVIMRQPNVMVVNPTVPAKTVPDFIAYAKANPGKLNFASSGTGTGNHLAGELFKMMTGVDLVHVPYRGNAPALTDLLGGQIHVMFPGLIGVMEYIRNGRLRALAVTSATRVDEMLGVPTMDAFVQGYESSGWYGVGAPRNVPVEIINTLNKEINAALADPAIKAQFAKLGGTVVGGAPSDFDRLIVDETMKWAKVIRFADLKAN